MNNKLGALGLFISLILTTAIGLSVHNMLASQEDAALDTQSIPDTTITKSELAQNNGQADSNCYIAIEGTVYQITDSSLWVEGEHTTSGGRAMCGLDLTDTIGQSPHGTSKLLSDKVTVIGTLE